MAEQSPGWNGFCLTHEGSNHTVKKLVNQDFCLCECWPAESFACAVVSDGHSTAPRGDAGSKIACALVLKIFGELRKKSEPVDSAKLRVHLINRWRAKVEADVEANPLTEAESAVATSYLRKGLTKPNAIWRMYGATVVAALLTDREAIYIQLGDGDIFRASSLKQISQPFPNDARQFANETFSLCSLNAHDEDICRIKVVPFTEHHPIFIWLSTDGIGNSYPDDPSFHKLISDSLGALKECGVQQFQPKLERHFEILYKEGCGDDFSAALLYDSTQREIKAEKMEGISTAAITPDAPAPAASVPTAPDLTDATAATGFPQQGGGAIALLTPRGKIMICLAIIFFVLAASTLIGMGWNRVDPKLLQEKVDENAALNRTLSKAAEEIIRLKEERLSKASELQKKIQQIDELESKFRALEKLHFSPISPIFPVATPVATPVAVASPPVNAAPGKSDDLKMVGEILRMIVEKDDVNLITGKIGNSPSLGQDVQAPLTKILLFIFPEIPFSYPSIRILDLNQLSEATCSQLLEGLSHEERTKGDWQIGIYSRYLQKAQSAKKKLEEVAPHATLPAGVTKQRVKDLVKDSETYNAGSSLSDDKNKKIRDAFDKWGVDNPDGVVLTLWSPTAKK